MSLIHGQTTTNILTPLLVDATGRPLVVVDSIGTVTIAEPVDVNIVSPLDGVNVAVDIQNASLAVDTELPAAAALADGAANPTTPSAGAAGLRWNGATWDRERGLETFSILASAARTATTLSATFTNYNARGLMVGWNITAVPGVQTVTLEVYGQTAPIGLQLLLLGSTAKVATGVFAYIVLPGVAAAAMGIDAVSGFPVPRQFFIRIAHSGAGSFTYVVDGCLLI